MAIPLPPPGFEGLRPDVPVKIYRRNLPHWRQDGASYFVTFRLADSLPAKHLRQLKRLRESWELHNPPPHNEEQLQELAKLISSKEGRFLDEGYGSCVLRDPECQKIVTTALDFFDLEMDDPRYELGAYTIMPNHVHLIVRPTVPEQHPLEKIIQSWKRFASREINKARGSKGSIWEEESFDRIIRDSEHLDRCIRYIGKNPGKAGLRTEQCRLWLRPEWRDLGWEFGEI